MVCSSSRNIFSFFRSSTKSVVWCFSHLTSMCKPSAICGAPPNSIGEFTSCNWAKEGERLVLFGFPAFFLWLGIYSFFPILSQGAFHRYSSLDYPYVYAIHIHCVLTRSHGLEIRKGSLSFESLGDHFLVAQSLRQRQHKPWETIHPLLRKGSTVCNLCKRPAKMTEHQTLAHQRKKHVQFCI